jgi:hypothetical protein
VPSKDGFWIHEYPADGIIITSSSQEFGWASDEILDVLEDGTHRPISSGNLGGRTERFSESGFEAGGGEPRIVFALKVIGDDDYWKRIDATEYDRKTDEAKQKIRNRKNSNSEPRRG